MNLEKTYSAAQLRAVAYMAAGATSSVWMERFPQEPMPTEKIVEVIDDVIKAFWPTAEIVERES